MTNSKSTKRALLSSAFAILICVAMLIGTTFAWFTDTASTAVNKIQAGTLDVALEMKNSEGNWVSAEGETLNFVKAPGAEAEKILWEPGCTYELPKLRVKNNGNLALKYKVLITGIKGDAKLNEAIEWTIGDVASGEEQHLLAGANNEFIIKGHMKEDAGNEYQGLSIDGISITVYATQDTVEHDSKVDTYDDGAEYPIEAVTAIETKDKDGATVTKADVILESAATVKVSNTEIRPLARAVVPAGVKVTNDATKLALKIVKTANPDGFTINTGMRAQTYDIKIIGVAEDNTMTIPVTLYIGKELLGVKLYHNSVLMSGYTYDANTGFISFKTATFSPFTIASYVKATTVDSAASLKTAVANAKSNDVIVLSENISLNRNYIQIEKPITVDLNGNTITQKGYATFVVKNGSDLTVTNGKFILEGSQPRAIVMGKGNFYGVDYNSAGGHVTVENVDFDVKGSQAVAISAGTNTGECLTINGGTYTVSGSQAKALDIGNCHAKISGIQIDVTGDADGINLSSVLEDTLVDISNSTVKVLGVSPFYDQDCINISGTNVNLTNCKLIVGSAAKSGRNIEMSANNWFDSKLTIRSCEIINESTGTAIHNNFGSPASFAHFTTTELYDTSVTAKYPFGSYKHNDSTAMFVVHSGSYSGKVPSPYYQVVLAEGSTCTNANGIYTVTKN